MGEGGGGRGVRGRRGRAARLDEGGALGGRLDHLGLIVGALLLDRRHLLLRRRRLDVLRQRLFVRDAQPFLGGVKLRPNRAELALGLGRSLLSELGLLGRLAPQLHLLGELSLKALRAGQLLCARLLLQGQPLFQLPLHALERRHPRGERHHILARADEVGVLLETLLLRARRRALRHRRRLATRVLLAGEGRLQLVGAHRLLLQEPLGRPSRLFLHLELLQRLDRRRLLAAAQVRLLRQLLRERALLVVVAVA